MSLPDARTAPGPAWTRAARPLRVRAGHSYHVGFTTVLGQRDTVFVQRAMTPLNRYFRWADAVSFTPEPGFDAIHSWNAVPLLTRRPYIVTFEDYLPRTPDDRRIPWLERALRARLLSPRCVALIATSDYARRQFCAQHAGFDGLPALLAKTEVLYPVVPPRRTRPKVQSGPLKLLFVGRDFMRKGGPVLLRAHARLRAQGLPVETTIVSNLHWSLRDYIGPPDAAYVRTALGGLAGDGIAHHRSLPSEAVQTLMEAADFLIFPTFHDTFGFVTLEAFAAGTPVIASATCVLPELIAEGETGYLLPFENEGRVGKWRWLYKTAAPGYLEAYEQATETMSRALVERLSLIWQDRAQYPALSTAALTAAHSRFHPDIARNRLEALYKKFRVAG